MSNLSRVGKQAQPVDRVHHGNLFAPWAPDTHTKSSNRTVFRFHWKLNHSLDYDLSRDDSARPSDSSWSTFILYLFLGGLAVVVLSVLLGGIIFIYRKYCLLSSVPLVHSHDRSTRTRSNHHTGRYRQHFDQNTRTDKSMIATIRSFNERHRAEEEHVC